MKPPLKLLRLDNLLQDKLTGTLLKVTRLDGNGIESFVIDRSKFPLPEGWQAERIPINGKWFKAFGFAWVPKRFEMRTRNCWTISGPGFTLRFLPVKKGDPSAGYVAVGISPVIAVAFVDELQNLCADLTRSILEVKSYPHP